jgi:ankyrin repeat protein
LAMLVPDGQTPLHSAASMNNLPALTVLLGAPETDCFAVDLHG